MKKTLVGMCVACLCLVGCTKADYSRNLQASTAQTTANIATKTFLDQCALSQYDANKKTVIDVATAVEKFLDDGRIGDLPLQPAKDAIAAFMIKKGWIAYEGLVLSIIDMAAMQQLPVDKLGLDTIAIIKLGLESCINSANTSRVEWRNPGTKSLGADAVAPEPVQRYQK